MKEKNEANNLDDLGKKLSELRDLGEKLIRMADVLGERKGAKKNGHYAVVPTNELLGGISAPVKPLRVSAALADAKKLAKKETKKLRGEGGYRVIRTQAKTARDAVWLPEELMRIPSV